MSLYLKWQRWGHCAYDATCVGGAVSGVMHQARMRLERHGVLLNRGILVGRPISVRNGSCMFRALPILRS
jgi:hypothetical protein